MKTTIEIPGRIPITAIIEDNVWKCSDPEMLAVLNDELRRRPPITGDCPDADDTEARRIISLYGGTITAHETDPDEELRIY